MTISAICPVYSLGLTEYDSSWALQQKLVTEVKEARHGGCLLLVEHAPVYTVGRGRGSENLRITTDRLKDLGAGFHRVDRGGDITFHGPGQLVVYPILNLGGRGRDVVGYVRKLEQVVIDTLASFAVEGSRISGRPGVWTDQNHKICALGVRISRGVTSHGFALNVSTDLSWFEHIVPCGIADAQATSLRQLLGERTPAMVEVRAEVVRSFARRFGVETIDAEGDPLEIRTEVAA